MFIQFKKEEASINACPKPATINPPTVIKKHTTPGEAIPPQIAPKMKASRLMTLETDIYDH